MIPSQMLKGTLEGCVLAVISKSETYGYEISRQLEEYGFGTIAEGTVYPLLLRLEKNGLITAVYRQSELGPKRKYYSLTEAGRQEMKEFFRNYHELTTAVEQLAGEMEEFENAETDEGTSEGE
ncbi:MAG TPA: PadR family transcriptional regulator [Candidatus Mediterraneibacter stercoripullorum]|nr:PadR family transcriptional regulator [Candidatus Mediterraneibacter stercoripullorum]